MEIFKQIAPLKAFLSDLKRQGRSIGLVPTMGALHKGHLSLINASKSGNDVTVGSIFVNPIQFNNENDLLKYPRSIGDDIKMLESEGCNVLFSPESEEMYPEKPAVSIDFAPLDTVMEGKYRPGHFSGVALVVSKLFNIVQPDQAYFGQKDWQQFAIIRKLTQELNFPVALHNVPTLRESDGLALSSRNRRLSPDGRQKANVFYTALANAKKALIAGQPVAEVKASAKHYIEDVPGVRLEYFELADSINLNPLENVQQSADPILCIAGYVGEVRLIDNMFLNS